MGTPKQNLLLEEEQVLQQLIPQFYGVHLLHIENTPNQYHRSIRNNYLGKASGILHKFTLGKEVLAKAEALPILTDSIATVVLPHILENSPNPHTVLQEVKRILTPDGFLIVTGLNPWSLHNLKRGRIDKTAISINKLQEWLSLLELKVTEIKTLKAPFSKIPQLQFDSLATGYILVAKNHVAPLSPVMPRWQPEKILFPGLNPSASSQQKKNSTERKGHSNE